MRKSTTKKALIGLFEKKLKRILDLIKCLKIAKFNKKEETWPFKHQSYKMVKHA